MAGRRAAPQVLLSESERSELKALAGRRKTAQPMAMRARIALACAEGLQSKQVAARLGVDRANGRKVAQALRREALGRALRRATVGGSPHRRRRAHRSGDLLQLNDEQRARLANDQTPSHAYRSGWSPSVLKKAGLLANPSRGYWSLKDQGRRTLETFPDGLDQETIAWINAFWWSKKEEAEVRSVAGTRQGLGLTAIERKGGRRLRHSESGRVPRQSRLDLRGHEQDSSL